MGFHVFLSHSTSDSNWVGWIANHATGVGLSVYLFEHDPQPGVLIADKVKAQIDRCDAFVVFVTANSVRSTYVQQEIGYAEKAQKPVVPLVQPGIPGELLGMLQGREYIPFDFSHPHKSIQTLVASLERMRQVRDRQQLIALGALGLLVVGAIAANR